MSITLAQRVEAMRQDGDGYGTGKRDAAPNERGNMIYRRSGSSERYVVDFASDFQSEGWLQFDTDQDAWYFGVWVNPRLRLTLTYAEGDSPASCVRHFFRP